MLANSVVRNQFIPYDRFNNCTDIDIQLYNHTDSDLVTPDTWKYNLISFHASEFSCAQSIYTVQPIQ
jgi:hypothetical protein